MSDITFVSTEELIDEIKRRFDVVSFMGIKRTTNMEGESLISSKGAIWEIMGACMEFQRMFMTEMTKPRENPDGHEPPQA